MRQLDFTSAAFKNDPFPLLAELVAAGPVVRTRMPVLGRVALVTTHAAADELLRDHHRFVREARNAGRSWYADPIWWISRFAPVAAENMLAKDEPDHRRLRRLVDDAFMRRRVDEMRPRVEALADATLDEMAAHRDPGGAVDFLHFARQFPLTVIAELLGLPDSDRPAFTAWASGLSSINSVRGLLGLVPRALKIRAYFREQIARCRREPGDGLLSLLVRMEQDGDSMSAAELEAMAFLLLFAGHETTTHLISVGLLTLLSHPDQRNRLAEDDSLVEGAVEEMLRHGSPVQFTKPRLPAEDTTLHGERLSQGEQVIALVAAANADPAVFDEPERFDIGRDPNPHLSFGAGIHFCLGMKLARLEAAVAFRRLLTRWPELSLATQRADLAWTGSVGLRALRSLPLRLGPESPAAGAA